MTRTTEIHPLLSGLLNDVLTSRVYDVARETSLDEAPRLSSRLGNEVLLKREDLQPVFSFKLRGAYNKIAHLTERERARGIITASAGNHAQGVAYSALKLKVKAVIVMPQTTPQIKVDAVRSMGAEAVLVGDSYAEAKAHCEQLVAATGMTFIHAFDDPDHAIRAKDSWHARWRLTLIDRFYSEISPELLESFVDDPVSLTTDDGGDGNSTRRN